AAPLFIDSHFDARTLLELTARHASYVRKRATDFLRVRHLEPRRTRDQRAGVADLAAAFRIERRVIENHLPLLALAQRVHVLLVLQERDDRARAGEVLVAAEIGLAFDRHAGAEVDAELAGFLALLALPFHGRFVARVIDRQAALARDVGSEVHRKAEGVVQAEHGLARNHL